MQQWNEVQDLGIMVVTLLLDGPGETPPDAQGALAWKQQFGLQSIYVLSDPTFSLVPGNSVGTPMGTIVDPRTMKVVHRQEGAGGTLYAQLEQLAMANKAMAE